MTQQSPNQSLFGGGGGGVWWSLRLKVGLHFGSKKTVTISIVFRGFIEKLSFFTNRSEALPITPHPLTSSSSPSSVTALKISTVASMSAVCCFRLTDTAVVEKSPVPSILAGGGGKTKEISMKNIGVKVLITNRIIGNSKNLFLN